MFNNSIGNFKFNRPRPIPAPNPDDQTGGVEIKKFTEMVKNLDENEKIIVAFLAENRSKNGMSVDLILDFLQSDTELKTKFSAITLELVQNTLEKVGTKKAGSKDDGDFSLTETQKNIARSVIKYDQKNIAEIITEKLWNDLYGEDENEEL